jgi:sulfur relay (sulfurtransferase) complex TusBCD TusD component (DsrE family)
VGGVSEQEPERLRRAVTRLMDAQQEALYVCNEALESRGVLESGGVLDDEARSLEAAEHLGSALEDVLAILDAASEDTRVILEGRDW